MKRHRIITAILLAVILMCGLSACNDDFTTNAYRTLSASKEFRETTLCSLGDLYQKGLISEEVKAEAIRLGDLYMRAHQLAVDAVFLYAGSKGEENKEIAQRALDASLKLYRDLAAFAAPYLSATLTTGEQNG